MTLPDDPDALVKLLTETVTAIARWKALGDNPDEARFAQAEDFLNLLGEAVAAGRDAELDAVNSALYLRADAPSPPLVLGIDPPEAIAAEFFDDYLRIAATPVFRNRSGQQLVPLFLPFMLESKTTTAPALNAVRTAIEKAWPKILPDIPIYHLEPAAWSERALLQARYADIARMEPESNTDYATATKPIGGKLAGFFVAWVRCSGDEMLHGLVLPRQRDPWVMRLQDLAIKVNTGGVKGGGSLMLFPPTDPISARRDLWGIRQLDATIGRIRATLVEAAAKGTLNPHKGGPTLVVSLHQATRTPSKASGPLSEVELRLSVFSPEGAPLAREALLLPAWLPVAEVWPIVDEVGYAVMAEKIGRVPGVHDTTGEPPENPRYFEPFDAAQWTTVETPSIPGHGRVLH